MILYGLSFVLTRSAILHRFESFGILRRLCLKRILMSTKDMFKSSGTRIQRFVISTFKATVD